MTTSSTLDESGSAAIRQKLLALEQNPRDEQLLSDVAEAAFNSPDVFVSVVRSLAKVPESTFIDVKKTPHPCGSRTTWRNYVSTQVAQPVRVVCPDSLDALRRALRAAADAGLPVRPVGSHHAWSDVALTDGVVIETSRLLEPVTEVDPSTLRDPSQAGSLRLVSGGMTIKALNKALDTCGLALINMGGYDGQTLAGAISTSTHGSGLELGAFPAFVEALVVVKSDGTVVHIEPATGGISNPATFKPGSLGVQLLQDDDCFEAAVVGVGCLGVILAVMLRVMPAYRLKQVREIRKWRELRHELQNGLPGAFRHVEVWINPHKVNGEHTALLTMRSITDEPLTVKKPLGNLFDEVLGASKAADDVLAWLFNTFPRLAPYLIDRALRSLAHSAPYVDVSYRMFNIGASNGFAAVCSELGVDLNGHIAAVDEMLLLAEHRARHDAFDCGPVILRYVAPSPGFLSMQPRATCMIELPRLRDVFGSMEFLWWYEQLLVQGHRARPHWGQVNFVTGSRAMVERLYGPDNVRRFLQVLHTFNPHNECRGRFTDRVGFTSHAPT